MPSTKLSMSKSASTSGRPKKPDTYICTRCGKVFNKVGWRKNFYTVKSTLWENNGGKIPVCNDCVKFYLDFYTKALGDVYSAYRRVCMKFDIYYNEDIVKSVTEKEMSSDRFGAYISQLGFARYQGKTYDDTILEEGEKLLYGDCVYNTVTEDGEVVNLKEEYDKLKEQNEELLKRPLPVNTNDDPEYIEVFGSDTGFAPREQRVMIRFYKEQIDQIPDSLIVTLDESIKNMARFKVLQARAVQINEMKEISNYATQFNNARKYVDTVVDKYKKKALEEDNTIAVGTLTETIERFTPASVYTVKSDFADVDRIGNLFNRFIGRPVKNFFTGSREHDPEYNIDEE